LDFHRQKPIGRYIADFYCPRLRLVIEIDGNSHEGREALDAIRQRWIESQGITVLRFEDHAVKFRMRDVLRQVEAWIDRRPVAHPPPPSAEDPSEGGE
jgi:very-short-patch-repair endonuclease